MNESRRMCDYCQFKQRIKGSRKVRCTNPDRMALVATEHQSVSIFVEAYDVCEAWAPRTRIYGVEDVLDFGKLRGTSVAYMAEYHKDYFMWLAKNSDYVKFSDEVWALFVGDDGELEEWRSTTVAS